MKWSNSDQIASISAGISLTSALVALVAAWFNRQSARASELAAKAAAESVELQRPRPIISLLCDFNANDGQPIPNFFVQNIGNSPAFDISISSMSVRGPLDNDFSISTTLVPVLGPNSTASQYFHFDNEADNPNDCNALVLFSKLVLSTKADNPIPQPKPKALVPFTISYFAIDGRRFNYEYEYAIYPITGRSIVRPKRSLLVSN